MNQELLDRLEIRQLVENWAIWRDAGYWDRFRTCWHEDGWMMATWIRLSQIGEATWEDWQTSYFAMMMVC